METEPHVIGIDELAALFDEQEAIGKTLPQRIIKLKWITTFWMKY